jgi:hypothetical protein
MRLKNTDMIEQAMVRIEILQAHWKALSEACNHIHMRKQHNFKLETGNIFETLVQEELHEWRNLFMWALTVDDDVRNRIKAAAHERFLSENTCVSSWLNDGVIPTRWLSSDEDEFREMARKVFMPAA